MTLKKWRTGEIKANIYHRTNTKLCLDRHGFQPELALCDAAVAEHIWPVFVQNTCLANTSIKYLFGPYQLEVCMINTSSKCLAITWARCGQTQ